MLLMPIILIFLYLKVFGFKVLKAIIIYLYIVIIFRTKLANTLYKEVLSRFAGESIFISIMSSIIFQSMTIILIIAIKINMFS